MFGDPPNGTAVVTLEQLPTSDPNVDVTRGKMVDLTNDKGLSDQSRSVNRLEDDRSLVNYDVDSMLYISSPFEIMLFLQRD